MINLLSLTVKQKINCF